MDAHRHPGNTCANTHNCPSAMLCPLSAVTQPQDVIQQLKQENEALKMQQQQQPKHHTSHGQQHKGVQDHSAHANGMALSSSRGPVSKSGIVELNVSGTTMTTSISALQQVRQA